MGNNIDTARAALRSKYAHDGVIHGTDLKLKIVAFWEALLTHPLAKPRWRQVPKVRFVRGRDPLDTASGIAYTLHHEIRVTIGDACDTDHATEVLLHELCHCAIPPVWGQARATAHGMKFRRATAHGMEFRAVLRDTAVKLFGIPCVEIPTKGRCYIIDDLIVREMRVVSGAPWRRGFWLKDTQPPPAKPVPTPCRVAVSKNDLAALPAGTLLRASVGGKEFDYIRVDGGIIGANPYASKTPDTLDVFSIMTDGCWLRNAA